MKSFESVERIIDSLIRRNGGLTLSYKNGVVDIFQPLTGYQVGYANIATIEYTDCIGKLENWLKELPEYAELGLWLNNGKLYVDKTAYFYGKEKAIEVSTECNELAIWSWADMDEITL